MRTTIQRTPTPGIPARSKGCNDETISDGSADHGQAMAAGMDHSWP